MVREEGRMLTWLSARSTEVSEFHDTYAWTHNSSQTFFSRSGRPSLALSVTDNV